VNLKSRLARLEQGTAPPQGACPHQPPVIVAEDESGGTATDTRVCWCGRERLRIRIVYADAWRGAEGSGLDGPEVVRLRWPDD